eukprot:3316368-Rhodomonas_salina.3
MPLAHTHCCSICSHGTRIPACGHGCDAYRRMVGGGMGSGGVGTGQCCTTSTWTWRWHARVQPVTSPPPHSPHTRSCS